MNDETETVQLNFRIKLDLLERLDSQIDGIQYLSRGHVLQIALRDWLNKQNEEKKEND